MPAERPQAAPGPRREGHGMCRGGVGLPDRPRQVGREEPAPRTGRYGRQGHGAGPRRTPARVATALDEAPGLRAGRRVAASTMASLTVGRRSGFTLSPYHFRSILGGLTLQQRGYPVGDRPPARPCRRSGGGHEIRVSGGDHRGRRGRGLGALPPRQVRLERRRADGALDAGGRLLVACRGRGCTRSTRTRTWPRCRPTPSISSPRSSANPARTSACT